MGYLCLQFFFFFCHFNGFKNGFHALIYFPCCGPPKTFCDHVCHTPRILNHFRKRLAWGRRKAAASTMSALLVIITMHFKVLKLKNDKAKALWTYRLFYKTFWNVELILSDKNANLANPSCNLIIFKTMELCVQCPCFMETFAKEPSTIDDFFFS